mmetsp:Transcript_101261/g.151716  ORF Transcript_101261/g.151716 Transcript_101261/m.151716 type:complete len:246 (+) Transcript_101261:1-738(+)
MRASTRSALALFLTATAALALLVHVTTDASQKTELMMRGRGFPALAEGEGEGDEYEVDEPEEDMEEEAPPPMIGFSHPEQYYESLHPVYARCKKQVNMPEFAALIQKTCGNIHELQTVAHPCRQAMWDASEKFGCCWESVLTGYHALYPHAYHAWRMWQGTLSGKSGVTFDDDSCGESEGEKGYHELKDEVGQLERTIEDQSYDIQYLQSQLGYDPYYYDNDDDYYYKDGKKGQQLRARRPVRKH